MAVAVDLTLGSGGSGPAAVARAVNLSRRQLGRLFRERIGFGPKALARLARFQRVLRGLEGGAPLGRLAARTGYYDQAHMSRDFRLFAGTTPTRYLREVREVTRHFLAEPA
jgi:transcriptional regulator GlxA family with amidase domain